MLEKYISKIKLNNLEEKNDFAITIGVFDGLHKGHQFILRELRKIAYENNLNSAVISFEENFSKKLKNLSGLLLTPKEKEELLSLLGIDYLFLIRFLPDVRNLVPEEFIKELINIIPVKYICVGENFRFGYKKKGDINTLKELSSSYGFNVKIFPLFMDSKEVLSSTLIRTLLEERKVEKAREKLGYFYFIKGKVIEGEKLGKKLGFPTANIEIPKDKLLPANGIYKGKIIIGSKFYPSAIYIGTKPTFNHHEKKVEVHILDYQGELLGEEVEIIFEEFIREERKFPSIEALVSQISKDIEYIKTKKEEHIHVITIDGPAGSGKTTIAKLLAKALDFNYLDSGALYRSVGWLAKEKNINTEEEILILIKDNPFSWYWDGDKFRIFYKENDISEIIRTNEIGNEASKVGTMPKIREILTQWQKDYFYNTNKGLILEGRDSGTIVFPSATLKVYLSANLRVRAGRRAQELKEDFEKVLNSIKERDLRDSKRIYAPLKIPEDAFIIDTSNLTPEEVVSKIISLFLKVK
ncbi:MAG: bifunctional riboflavin kinase/FAD synthetase [Dictyoglomaceae bacterium]